MQKMLFRSALRSAPLFAPARFAFSTQYLQHFVNKLPQKYELKIVPSEQIPTIVRKPDELLVQQWWSQTPFDSNKALVVPVFSLKTGEYLKQGVELDQKIFNVPLRRDIVHNVLLWRQRLYKILTAVSKTRSTVAGSGKKPLPQKGTGKARQGSRRGPHMRGGAVAHGKKIRTLRIKMNKKQRIQALRVLLSARLAEGKLRVVDKEALENHKTKQLAAMLDNLDEGSRFLVITPYQTDRNFELASGNLERLTVCTPDRINVLKLLNAHRIIITLDALRQLTQEFNDRIYRRYRLRNQKYEPTPSDIEKQQIIAGTSDKRLEEAKPVYDPTKPLELKFRILRDYLEQYEKAKKEGTLDKYHDNYFGHK